MSAINIYDFESPIEHSIAAGLAAAGLTVGSPTEFYLLGTLSTEESFQKTRPRVEVVFRSGAEKKSYAVMTDGTLRNASWLGTLTCYIVSGTNIVSHRNYRAQVRNVLALLRNTANTDLDYHKLQNITETGTSVDYKPEDGYYASTITFQVDFGIDAGAWAELNTP